MKTVIEMARESRIDVYGIGCPHDKFVQVLERFAELARADEREACAKVCDDIEQAKNFSGPMHCAASIRARSNT
jgi:hypothetical protein